MLSSSNIESKVSSLSFTLLLNTLFEKAKLITNSFVVKFFPKNGCCNHFLFPSRERADLQLTRTGDKTNITSSQTQEVGSRLLSANNININSGSGLSASQAIANGVGSTNIKGELESLNGDITIVSKNDTNIEALKSTSTHDQKSEGFTQTVTLGASYGKSSVDDMIASLMGQLSLRESKSSNTDVTFTNSSITASNGVLNIDSGDDTNVRGADLLASNVILNSGNNLNIESLQNTSSGSSKSKSIGAGGGSSLSLNYNSSRSESNRDWVDDQTSVIGTNGVTINTGNNTDVKGAVIANIDSNGNDLGNLNITTNTLTHSDIKDTEKSRELGFGMQLAFGITEPEKQNGKIKTDNLVGGVLDPDNSYIEGTNKGHLKEQVTRATIGNGTINTGSDISNLNRDVNKSQEITSDKVTNGFEGRLHLGTAMDLGKTVQMALSRGKDMAGKAEAGEVGTPHNLSKMHNDPYNAHDMTARDGGSEFHNPIVSLISRAAGELLYQVPFYGSKDIQDIQNGTAGGSQGTYPVISKPKEYWPDIFNDIGNQVKGTLGLPVQVRDSEGVTRVLNNQENGVYKTQEEYLKALNSIEKVEYWGDSEFRVPSINKAINHETGKYYTDNRLQYPNGIIFDGKFNNEWKKNNVCVGQKCN